MKYSFKKLVASIVTITTLMGVPHTLAVEPSYEELNRYRQDKITEFENLAPGIFKTRKGLRRDIDMPREIGIVAETATTAFTRYPHIKNEFVRQIQTHTTKHIFKIRPFKREDAALLTNVTEDTLDHPELLPAAYYGVRGVERFELSFNGTLMYFTRKLTYEEPGLKDSASVEPSTPYIKYCVSHEMGHLITFELIYRSHPELLRRQQELYIRIKDIQSRETPPTHEEISALKAQNDEMAGEMAKIFEPIKQHIIGLARAKGYIGNGYITKYGENNAWEWLAELFAHIMCNTKPNLLGQAMNEWLMEEDVKLAVVN